MRISGINFPTNLLNALRDNTLVVFAGAGTSMSPPANLPDFRGLANAVALGTGIAMSNDEPEDRFLGRLRDAGVRVHDRASEELSKYGENPTELHRHLLRLFPEGGPLRIVTTNFDRLFEAAADYVYTSTPRVFKAPALPVARGVNGVIHLHGSLDQPEDTVLTDTDFGRAYLTEGWARRFLVDLFNSFSVLFVGYSHHDTVMNYLTRALTPVEARHRFALVDETDADRWQFLGIQPITYPNSDGTHSALSLAVGGLATHVRRGVLARQQQIAGIANAAPLLVGEEDADLIDEAFSVVAWTRFFTAAATDPAWVTWTAGRQHLNNLFNSGHLTEPDKALAEWLATKFAISNSDVLFELISRYAMRIHPEFWFQLGRAVGLCEDQTVDRKVIAQWVSLLIDTAPLATHLNTTWTVFDWLSKRCNDRDLQESLVELFDTLTPIRLGSSLLYSTIEPTVLADHFRMNLFWENRLKPRLQTLAEPLLADAVKKLRRLHAGTNTWQYTDQHFDKNSWHRSAIEPHQQDNNPEGVDVVIDTARDCLEYLASNDPAKAAYWCDAMIEYEAPLLHRLAVHNLPFRNDLTSDVMIEWILTKIGLHDGSAHHEIYQAMRAIYPATTADTRQNIIDAVLAYQWPRDQNEEKAWLTAHHHFEWLHWLSETAPDCPITKDALNAVLAIHKDFRPREHPDLMFWVSSGPIAETSAWSADQLLSRPAPDWLEPLISFQDTGMSIYSLRPVLDCIIEAAMRDPQWGIDLANALTSQGHWSTDLWTSLFRAWSNELGQDAHEEILHLLDHDELLQVQLRPVADLLLALVKDGGISYAYALLPKTNAIARALKDYVDQKKPFPDDPDWLMQSMNHPSGVLAQYWLHSLATWRQNQEPIPSTLNDEYSAVFTEIVQGETLDATLGKAILATAVHFLLTADYDWTKDYLLPRFQKFDDGNDAPAMWQSFTYVPLNPQLAELMEESFLGVVPKMDAIFPSQKLRNQFIRQYSTMVVYYVEDPLTEWIPTLFTHAGTTEDRREFTWWIGSIIRGMEDLRQRELWQRFLEPYWKARLGGVPPPALDAIEIGAMLDWLPHLSSIFPEAVELAISTSPLLPDQHFLIDEIIQGNLWQTYPDPTARMLVHLGKSVNGQPSFMWYSAKELIDNLLPLELSQERKEELRELVARLGLQ